jgi:hypothetical protein
VRQESYVSGLDREVGVFAFCDFRQADFELSV